MGHGQWGSKRTDCRGIDVMNTFNRISVVGLGYIGLPTAAVFANQGVEVIGVDVKADVVDSINRGKPHFG